MWGFLWIIAVFLCSADGQDSDICKSVPDFERCSTTWTCDLAVSQCFCKSETPYCRCNNYIDEFYLGKSCSQKWTALTFALVATLPGVALAFVIGLSVHLAHRFRKSSDSHRAGHELTHMPEQDPFPGVVFASDLPAHRPPGPTPMQTGVPMASSQLYSVPGNTQFPPGGPPMGAPRPPMGAPRPPMGAPHPQYSPPPLSPTLSRPEQPPYSAAGAHVLSNPYARARNPYEDNNVSMEPYNRAAASYEEQRMAPPPPPSYAAPEHHSAFPRPQISLRY